MKVKRIALSPSGKKYSINDLNISLNINEGELPRTKLKEDLIQTSKGEYVHLYDANFKDNFVNIQKPAAIINPKDSGMIITKTGMTKDFIVIDAGAGSGALACTLASLCKKVYCYDINEKHVEAVNQNIQDLELNNITCELKDVYTLDPVEKVDLMTIDVPEPWRVLEVAKKALKKGGYLVLYTPQITQAQKAILELDQDFHHEVTCELIKRDWEIEGEKVRPSHTMLGHTAFLTFIRYYPKLVKTNIVKKTNPKKSARLERLKHKKELNAEEELKTMNSFNEI